MNRPRVLCVSSDRSTRASVTLSLTDTPVNVLIAQDAATAVERLQTESVDAIVVDARTIENVSTLVDAVESTAPETPTFVHWGENTIDSVDVLAEVVARADETDSTDRLAAALTDRIGTEAGNPAPNPNTAVDNTGIAALDALVGAVRRRLVDVTSPIAVDQVLREEFTNTDRFSFAWVGEYDRGEQEVIPWLIDPTAMEWPMHRTFSVGDGEYPLLERTMHTQELQTFSAIDSEPDAVPFGHHATDNGIDTIAVAPLAAKDDLYGVVAVYAPDPLSSRELEAIDAVAATASHVLESIAVRGRLDQQERLLHRYERLVETAGDGMYVLDDADHLMTVNDALVAMTGYSREGLLGEHISFLFPENDVEAGVETTERLLTSEERTATLEMTLETKGGATIPCEIQLAILDHDGEFRGSVGVVRDVTERKRDQRRLREQNERLDAFAAIVSHDLRNPLSVAQGYLALAEETGSIDHLDKVRDGLDRMESIIADVLAIARDGEWATDIEPVELEAVATEAWDHVTTNDARLAIEGSVTLEADRSRFLRLLENCFRNAVEHGGADVSIRVGSLDRSTADGSEPSHDSTDETMSRGVRGFFVEDNGRGFPDDFEDQLFDPSVSSSSGELGFGLWIVREVATGHGWSVTATKSTTGGARLEFETTA